jgi:hypothetical protein
MVYKRLCKPVFHIRDEVHMGGNGIGRQIPGYDNSLAWIRIGYQFGSRTDDTGNVSELPDLTGG